MVCSVEVAIRKKRTDLLWNNRECEHGIPMVFFLLSLFQSELQFNETKFNFQTWNLNQLTDRSLCHIFPASHLGSQSINCYYITKALKYFFSLINFLQQQLEMPHVLNRFSSDLGIDHVLVSGIFDNSTFFINLQNENQLMWTEKRVIFISVTSFKDYYGEQDLLAKQMGKCSSSSWYISC